MDSATMSRVIRILEKEYPGFPRHYREEPFRALISTVLSQRTRDETTDRIAESLFRTAKNPRQISKMSLAEIRKIIKPINFYKTKARRILRISMIINEKYAGKVPGTRDELMGLPGVGKKTADAVLSFSFGKNVIPVDTHVEVLCKRLGVADEGDSYDEIQKKLYAIVPPGGRNVVNFLMVEHGKKICTKHMPRHCKCSLRKYCRFFRKSVAKA